jgi:hypothetical protein
MRKENNMGTVALIELAMDGLAKLVELIFKLKTIAVQNAELTQEQSDQLDKDIEDIMSKTWWQVGNDPSTK